MYTCIFVYFDDFVLPLLGGTRDAEKGSKSATGHIMSEKPVWMTEGFSAMLKMGSGFYKYTIPYESLENVIDTSDYLCRHVVIPILVRNETHSFCHSERSEESSY